ncbi:MAG: ATP-binding protein [Phycisphaerales bacterium]|nr:ATP-binding protein [Phycisphaerales bacterium]
MYARLQQLPDRSFFLFGPRGTGKSAWLHHHLPGARTFDLLRTDDYQRLLAAPQRLRDEIPDDYHGWVVIDEVQRVPALLDEVHALIEQRQLRFALTGSSARKLRRGGANLLAGRARTLRMHPLSAVELGHAFDLARATRFGGLPFACTTSDPAGYLRDYVVTYLREEVLQEGLVRNLPAFARFLEAASFSQGAALNMAAIARECAVSAKLAESHFTLLEDLLLATRVPVFARRAARRLASHPKFYFFDAGVYRTLRPRGPLDGDSEIDGPSLETVFLANVRAVNDAEELGYGVHYWRTAVGVEVDFVLYGERGLLAFEIKRSDRVRDEDLASLRAFAADYPEAKCFLLHGGRERRHAAGVEIAPLDAALRQLPELLRDAALPPPLRA